MECMGKLVAVVCMLHEVVDPTVTTRAVGVK